MASASEDISITLPNQIRHCHVIPPQAEYHTQNTPYISLASYPPLSQVTTVTEGPTIFTVVIFGATGVPWEVSLWSNYKGKDNDWHDVPVPHSMTPNEDGTTPDYFIFSTTINVTRSFQFTLKYRQSPHDPWRWFQSDTGRSDGTVLVKNLAGSAGAIPEDIKYIIKDLNPDLKVWPRVSQSPGANVWRVDASVESSHSSEKHKFAVGSVLGGYIRWFALARLSKPWLGPLHGTKRFDTDKQVMMVSFLNNEGVNVVFLAVSGIGNTNTWIESNCDGGVCLGATNDSADCQPGILVVSACHRVENAIAAALYEARSIVSPFVASVEGFEATGEPSKEVESMWYENWYDGLGYCTWNSLGCQLTADKLYAALGDLSTSGINISNLIIDDGWQSVDNPEQDQKLQGMTRFEADAQKFPEGLKKTVANIKSSFGIRNVGVWHAMFGYWGGISPHGELGTTYDLSHVERNSESGGHCSVVCGRDVQKFYNDFYAFLVSCGITSVKCDAQYMLDEVISAPDRRELTRSYQDAWTIASLRYFSNMVTSCMSQVPSIIYYSQLPARRVAPVVRNSDDYFPGVAGAQTWHLWANAYNAILARYLNVVPDWDMFQTHRKDSYFHAAARAISGGPIYITDEPGKHDLKLLGELCVETVRGRTVVLRPSSPGRAMDPYVGYQDNVLLKVATYHGSITGTALTAVFNVSPIPLAELIPLRSFSAVNPESSQLYIVRSHVFGQITPLLSPIDDPVVTIKLPVMGYDVLSAYLTTTVHGSQVAGLGLLGKMVGAAAVVSCKISELHGGRVSVDVLLKGLGVFGIYISEFAGVDVHDSCLVTIMGEVIPRETISIDPTNPDVVLIDVERAWREMGLRSGWANEVEVKAFITVV